MQAPEPLLQRLQHTPGMEQGRRLVLLLTQLGDFDSMEYAQALVPVLPKLETAGIRVRAIAIGDSAGADRFCRYTGFPREALEVDAVPNLHQELGLYEGLQTPGETLDNKTWRPPNRPNLFAPNYSVRIRTQIGLISPC